MTYRTRSLHMLAGWQCSLFQHPSALSPLCHNRNDSRTNIHISTVTDELQQLHLLLWPCLGNRCLSHPAFQTKKQDKSIFEK